MKSEFLTMKESLTKKSYGVTLSKHETTLHTSLVFKLLSSNCRSEEIKGSRYFFMYPIKTSVQEPLLGQTGQKSSQKHAKGAKSEPTNQISTFVQLMGKIDT